MSEAAEPGRLGAVVLAGGTGARMGCVDKASLEMHGVTLLERVLAAASAATEIVVVGQRTPTSRPVSWTVERPPRGGPAAGLLAGLDCFVTPPDLVAVIAVDMPAVTAATLARLAEAVTADVDGAVLVDDAGRRQTLAAVYRHASLATAAPARAEDRHGMPMRRLVGGLRLAEVPALGEEASDVDTWEGLRELRDQAR